MLEVQERHSQIFFDGNDRPKTALVTALHSINASSVCDEAIKQPLDISTGKKLDSLIIHDEKFMDVEIAEPINDKHVVNFIESPQHPLRQHRHITRKDSM